MLTDNERIIHMISSVNNQIFNLKETYSKENIDRRRRRIKHVKIFEEISIEKATRITNRIKKV